MQRWGSRVVGWIQVKFSPQVTGEIDEKEYLVHAELFLENWKACEDLG
jgi:hypothetical protein